MEVPHLEKGIGIDLPEESSAFNSSLTGMGSFKCVRFFSFSSFAHLLQIKLNFSAPPRGPEWFRIALSSPHRHCRDPLFCVLRCPVSVLIPQSLSGSVPLNAKGYVWQGSGFQLIRFLFDSIALNNKKKQNGAE